MRLENATVESLVRFIRLLVKIFPGINLWITMVFENASGEKDLQMSLDSAENASQEN